MSILLLEDLAIVPLLAMIAFLAPGGKTVTMADRAAGVAIGLSAVARLFRASQHKAVERLVLIAQGGEFTFVLYAAALSVGLITTAESATLTAVIILSMVMTPLFVILHDRLMLKAQLSTEGLPAPEDDGNAVLLVGFGQVVSQPLLRMGHCLAIIDTDPGAITTARDFGFKVCFGDGTRLDILRAAGAGHAHALVIAIDNQGAATRIARLLHEKCPLIPAFAGSFDRRHSMQPVRADVKEPIREAYESALATGAILLRHLGAADERVAETLTEVRLRDADRLAPQLAGDSLAGRDLMLRNAGMALESSD